MTAADLERLGELMAGLLADCWQKQTAEGGTPAASETEAGGARRGSDDQLDQPD